MSVFYTATSGKNKGLEIEVFPVEAMKIQKARDVIKMPSRPMYETKTPSGKTQSFPLDEISAAQSPQDTARWKWYMEERRNALIDQNNSIARTLFFYGTGLKKLPKNGWEDEQTLLGFEIPENAELKRAHFLMTELSAGDVAGLIAKIMEQSGVTEDEIKEAEETFRDQVQS